MGVFKIVNFAINLDGSQHVYQSGQTISGSVNIKLIGELKLSLVTILLKSVSAVELHQYPLSFDAYTGADIVFSESEQYLDVTYELPDNSKCLEFLL